MKTYSIINTEEKDLDFVFYLYDEAIKYQKRKKFPFWKTYDKEVLRKDVADKRQFKIVIENQIACVFSICFTDKIVWRERDIGDSVFLHRIVVNPKFKGQKNVGRIMKWTIDYCKKNGFKYIRLDTWAENENIIYYYKSYGFKFLEFFQQPNDEALPSHQRGENTALLEFKI